ncbi:hypothetical protein NDU88_002760, partial [Pleurodeles waltl]
LWQSGVLPVVHPTWPECEEAMMGGHRLVPYNCDTSVCGPTPSPAALSKCWSMAAPR